MELVEKLVEKYPPTQEEVKEALENADTGSSLPETIRNVVVDLGSAAATGALGAGASSLITKIVSRKPARAAAREALESLKNGVDDSLGHQTSLIKKGTSYDDEIVKMMGQNKNAAKHLFEGDNGNKALRTVIKNVKREAEIGPRFMDDIQYILQKDTGLTEKEVNKALKKFMKENANKVELLTLIEAKEPIATYSHSLAVQDLAYKLAKKAGINENKARNIAEAAVIHDIGKVRVPDSIISSTADFTKYPNLKKWMNDHDVVGGEILRSDPFKSRIAREHHGIPDSEEVGVVKVADVYEALTTPKRSYKSGLSKDEAFSKLRKDVDKGLIQEEYYDFLRALNDDGLLKDSYNYISELEAPYRSMKANEIKKQVAHDYYDQIFNNAIKSARRVGWATGAIVPTSLPSVSEILTEFSPTFRPKADKLEEIKDWYNKGVRNDEIDKLIVNTDFKDNKQVTKLWKLMHDQFKD